MKETSPLCWQIWFDGSAAPNPGKIGIGGVLLSPRDERHEIAILHSSTGCNNEAELLALCVVLKRAAALGAQEIIVRGDSDVAIQHASGQAPSAFARMAPLIEQSQELLSHFTGVQLVWVPRHRNLDADRLSRKALGLPASLDRRHSAKRKR